MNPLWLIKSKNNYLPDRRITNSIILINSPLVINEPHVVLEWKINEHPEIVALFSLVVRRRGKGREQGITKRWIVFRVLSTNAPRIDFRGGQPFALSPVINKPPVNNELTNPTACHKYWQKFFEIKRHWNEWSLSLKKDFEAPKSLKLAEAIPKQQRRERT